MIRHMTYVHDTTCRSTACRALDVQYQSVSMVFFFFRECLWVINLEAHAAHCRMASAVIIPDRILPHNWYRVCPFWTVRCDSCHDEELHGIRTWKLSSVVSTLLLLLTSGVRRCTSTPVPMDCQHWSLLLPLVYQLSFQMPWRYSCSSSNRNFVINWFFEP